MEILKTEHHDEIWSSAQKLKYFRPFVPKDASQRLSHAGINLNRQQIHSLTCGLEFFEEFNPELYTTKDIAASEQRIVDLCKELAVLIESSPTSENGARYAWFPGPDDLEAGEEQICVVISDFLKHLQAIEASAEHGVRSLNASLVSRLLPKSNRANRSRYFYWLLLLAFWKNDLGRSIGTSTGENGPCGPLISFIQALSEGAVSEGILNRSELSVGAIRQFIRRNADVAEKYTVNFLHPDWSGH